MIRRLGHAQPRALSRAYTAPLRDMRFLLFEVFNMPKHWEKLRGNDDVDQQMCTDILEGVASFSEKELAPTNVIGDQKGLKLVNGDVQMPAELKAAYDKYVELGYQGLSVPEEFGGMGLPLSLNLVKSEMLGSANWSWSMCPGLSMGAINTLLLHGSQELKETYLPKMAEGTWSGTMCLTEPQCGSDLNQVKTSATPNDDGSFNISGTKIYISCGDSGMTENVLHVVLARLPNAPPGTKGISLFAVPKFFPTKDGGVGDRNKGAMVTGLEDKMGIHASPTCVVTFENAKGWLIGTPNRGLNHMFTFINTSRLGTALQGVALTELSHQYAVAFAKERRSLRDLEHKKGLEPDHPADRIINYPDVRKMLLIQRCVAEGGRAMILDCARHADFLMTGDEELEKKADDQLAFLTPILKGFLTELGVETTSLGMQCFGGHGFIRGNKQEQLLRDARIASMYEGTTGIQGLDLLGRKIMLGKMKPLFRHRKRLTRELHGFVKDINGIKLPFSQKWEMLKMCLRMYSYLARWQLNCMFIGANAMKKRNWIGSSSVDFLMYSGYTLCGHYWLRQMTVAAKALPKAEGDDKAFYQAKIDTAQFYFAHVLPRADGLARSMLAKPSYTLQFKEESFATKQ